jgi:2',3'-cyclic-nucleotide 2'-phosphodiesterase (5'-nucleotidase family)
MLLVAALVSGCAPGEVVLLFTADAEGAIHACSSCSADNGLGDLARRSTAVAAERRRQPATMLADAGNFLIGPDSIGSGGRVMAEAYRQLGYNVVNVSFREFRLGRTKTVSVLATSGLRAVSANLIDEATGKRLFPAYVTVGSGGLRTAFIGLTELPAGVEGVEHIRTQLAGVRIRPPREALAEWLPKARAEADRVVVLFYGDAAGLDAVRREANSRVAVILVGGLRASDVPTGGSPLVVATADLGKQLTRVTLPRSGPAGVSRIDVDARFSPDRSMVALLKAFRGR